MNTIVHSLTHYHDFISLQVVLEHFK